MSATTYTPLFSALLTSTSEVGTSISLRVGTAPAVKAGGKDRVLYARFRLDKPVQSELDVITLLASMPDERTITVSLPKIDGAILSISLRPVYRPIALATVLASYLKVEMPKPDSKGEKKTKPGRKGEKKTKPGRKADVAPTADPAVANGEPIPA